MTAQETSILVGALVGLMGALQLWLAARSVQHGQQLNGLMAPRIAAGAAAVAVAEQARVQALPDTNPAAAHAARIIALEAELAKLKALP